MHVYLPTYICKCIHSGFEKQIYTYTYDIIKSLQIPEISQQGIGGKASILQLDYFNWKVIIL